MIVLQQTKFMLKFSWSKATERKCFSAVFFWYQWLQQKLKSTKFLDKPCR